MFEGVFSQSSSSSSSRRRRRHNSKKGRKVINASNDVSDFLQLINVDEPGVSEIYWTHSFASSSSTGLLRSRPYLAAVQTSLASLERWITMLDLSPMLISYLADHTDWIRSCDSPFSFGTSFTCRSMPQNDLWGITTYDRNESSH